MRTLYYRVCKNFSHYFILSFLLRLHLLFPPLFLFFTTIVREEGQSPPTGEGRSLTQRKNNASFQNRVQSTMGRRKAERIGRRASDPTTRAEKLLEVPSEGKGRLHVKCMVHERYRMNVLLDCVMVLTGNALAACPSETPRFSEWRIRSSDCGSLEGVVAVSFGRVGRLAQADSCFAWASVRCVVVRSGAICVSV
ncbi:hypothetical protein RJT34_13187 [Clitoria ternatea]|uniref:Uncharacterized protein n=1 Tax=Clitoria ternatea TaxID=43366 RepID=A0AAN9PL77_CLITE